MKSRPAAAQLGGALLYVAHIESLLAIGVLSLLVSAVEWSGTLPWSAPLLTFPAARALPAVYCFLALRKAAEGSRRLPLVSDFRDSWDALIFPILQLTVAATWYAGPLLVLAARGPGLRSFVTRHECRAAELLRRPGWEPYLAAGVGLLYMPAALLAAVLTNRLWRLLDPTWGFRFAARAPRGYLITFALICMLTVVLYLTDTAGVLLQEALPIPLATPVVRQMIVLWVPLAQARLLGEYIDQHRAQLVLGGTGA